MVLAAGLSAFAVKLAAEAFLASEAGALAGADDEAGLRRAVTGGTAAFSLPVRVGLAVSVPFVGFATSLVALLLLDGATV